MSKRDVYSSWILVAAMLLGIVAAPLAPRPQGMEGASVLASNSGLAHHLVMHVGAR